MAHWIQLELNPEGSSTYAIIIDLEQVTRVLIERVKGELTKANFDYNTQAIVIEGTTATNFIEQFEKFTGELKHKDPEGKWSNIEIAKTNSLGKPGFRKGMG